ncbi:hypothetical protein D8S78_14990 [Natrialba swarupiae]|nr:hypothetical protein [Natrialba swarupiae]
MTTVSIDATSSSSVVVSIPVPVPPTASTTRGEKDEDERECVRQHGRERSGDGPEERSAIGEVSPDCRGDEEGGRDDERDRDERARAPEQVDEVVRDAEEVDDGRGQRVDDGDRNGGRRTRIASAELSLVRARQPSGAESLTRGRERLEGWYGAMGKCCVSTTKFLWAESGSLEVFRRESRL